MSTEATPGALGSHEGLGPLLEAAGYRTRYRSEPGMIGHYPWTYADQSRRRADRPSCEYEDLYTADQVRALLAAERERCAKLAEGAQQLPNDGKDFANGWCSAALQIAQAIRA